MNEKPLYLGQRPPYTVGYEGRSRAALTRTGHCGGQCRRGIYRSYGYPGRLLVGNQPRISVPCRAVRRSNSGTYLEQMGPILATFYREGHEEGARIALKTLKQIHTSASTPSALWGEGRTDVCKCSERLTPPACGKTLTSTLLAKKNHPSRLPLIARASRQLGALGAPSLATYCRGSASWLEV